MRERDFWLAFSVAPGIGPLRFHKLLQHFDTAKNAWEASPQEIEKAVKSRKLVEELEKFKRNFSLEEYVKHLKEEHVWFLILEDKEYPQLLKQIDKPPFVLYGKGNRAVLQDKKTIGIVGTRKVTAYGRQVTEQLTSELVNAGFTIVSGLALGVDAIAHATTIENNGKTIAVLGSGVDVCFPSSNQRIYTRIITEQGCVVSEYPLGTKPSIGSFPARNRIIAGLSHAVLVTEGAEDSGSLITASNALLYKRPVFAVPGPITSILSKGPLKLLKEGAILVTSGEDILSELGVVSPPSPRLRRAKGETKEEQRIINLLQNESLFLDEIIKKTKYSSSQVSMILTMLELRGIVHAEHDGRISLKTP